MTIRNDIVVFNESQTVIPLLQDIVDETTFKIISSTIDTAKTVFLICDGNKIPVSSTYKKIRKLKYAGLVFIEKIEIDDKGKKIIHYKSKVKTLEFSLKKDGILLQFHKNDYNTKLLLSSIYYLLNLSKLLLKLDMINIFNNNPK